MSHQKLRPFIVKVSVLGYFPLHIIVYIKYIYMQCILVIMVSELVRMKYL